MTPPWFRSALAAALVISSAVPAVAQKTDFNEVGRQMAVMLQNSHFARPEFNEELSRRFLEDYLEDLDFQRLYFTREDVERFSSEYGGRLHTMLLQGKSLEAATDIYRVFEKRVEERVALTNRLLEGEFTFDKPETVMLSRKKAMWPSAGKESEDLWRRQIKEAVLGEVLRREMLSKLAKEQGKPDPGSDDRSPKEKIALRYKRFLSSVKDVDDEEVANYFLSSVARSYDPHTDYMSAREMSRFKDGMKNELVGIGALLQAEEDGATKIMGIVIGGPADREGTLKLNDRVVAVDMLNSGKPGDMTDIMFMKIDKVVDMIRGKEGTSVALKVEPASGPAGETRIVVIERGKVEMKDEQASGELVEMKTAKGPRRVGVITLPSFYADFEKGEVSCADDVERILKRLVEAKMEGLVLDLRNNGGGSLEEVRRMTGFFTGGGPVVQVRNTQGQVLIKDSDDGKPLYGGPMVVLTDKSSASASEILAGALQDYHRAVVIGESSTFGKGTVQQPMDISRMLPLFAARDRAGVLKLTIQKFYRPSGSSTQMEGVRSDIVLPSVMDALEIGEEHLDNALAHDRIRSAPAFEPGDPQALPMARLKELSRGRVEECKDFKYIIEDVMKTKQRIDANVVSLDKKEREKELAESDARQKARNAERRKRFEEMTRTDKERMKFFRVTLDGLDKGGELEPFDPSDDSGEYMRRAKDDAEDLDETPKWPSGLDPVKRESLAVLGDLVDLTAASKVAGVER